MTIVSFVFSWRLGGSLLLLLLVVGLVLNAWVAVDETQFVLVTDFGRVARVYGSEEAGLHLKWPWQSVLTIDRRLQVFEPPAREALTGDKRNLDIAPYVVWRVVEPERFVRSSGSLASAEARLAERVSAALNGAVGRVELKAFATTDAQQWRLDALMSEVRDEVAAPARSELGVEVLDIQLRRFQHPLEVRPAVFDLIRSERRQVAATLRAEGEARYQEITSRADRDRDAILASADAEAERIRGRADAESIAILNEVHARDPKFYEFVRSLETYRALLDDRATVVLSSASPLLRLLTQGPPGDLLEEKVDASAAEPATGPPR